jgi:hypothetical protein
MSVVLFIGDLHIPAIHPGALDHVKEIADIVQPTEIVFAGDMVDLHRASFHEHDPDMPSLSDELRLCKEMLRPWIAEFPIAKICNSNHDDRIKRVARSVGLPDSVIKSTNHIFDLPDTWVFADDFIIDEVRYSHGMDCKGGSAGPYNSVTRHRRSQVYGHWHSFAGITWTATEHDLLFGFNAGALCDPHHMAMRYGKWFVNKPILGCGVVIDGRYPQFYPMDLGSKVKYVK